jgi:hypothetical protein
MKTVFLSILTGLLLFSACKKTTQPPIVLAQYTLGSGGDCTGSIISGRFVADTALTANNTVTITVDVEVAGPYWITTNSANGISFSDIGTFTSTGTQTAVLTGTGTPVDTGVANFTITPLSGPGGSCTFSVTTVEGIPPQYYVTCLLNGVYRNFSDSLLATNSNIPGTSGLTGLDISGRDTIINSVEKVDFGVNGPANIGTGSYADTSSVRAYFSYLDSTGQAWVESASGQPSFTIVVTNVTAGIAQGTFSGTIKNQQGMGTDSLTVTNGLFSVPVK